MDFGALINQIEKRGKELDLTPAELCGRVRINRSTWTRLKNGTHQRPTYENGEALKRLLIELQAAAPKTKKRAA